MKFDKALQEAQVEIVPPNVDPAGVRVTINGKVVPYGKIDNQFDMSVAQGLKAAVKEVFTYVNKQIGKLDAFQVDQPPPDITFKADGTAILTPDKPIEYQGKTYNEFSYKLKNTKALQALGQVGSK